jgi:hypothetical protein
MSTTRNLIADLNYPLKWILAKWTLIYVNALHNYRPISDVTETIQLSYILKVSSPTDAQLDSLKQQF